MNYFIWYLRRKFQGLPADPSNKNSKSKLIRKISNLPLKKKKTLSIYDIELQVQTILFCYLKNFFESTQVNQTSIKHSVGFIDVKEIYSINKISKLIKSLLNYKTKKNYTTSQFPLISFYHSNKVKKKLNLCLKILHAILKSF